VRSQLKTETWSGASTNHKFPLLKQIKLDYTTWLLINII